MTYVVIFGVLAVAALAGTIRETLTDGRRRVPTRPELVRR